MQSQSYILPTGSYWYSSY